MTTDQNPDASEPPEVIAHRKARRNLRLAIAFGVVMATIEMGALLYFMYC
jgi:hypothetical protein